MVVTRRSASVAASLTIPEARASRRERRAREAEQTLIGNVRPGRKTVKRPALLPPPPSPSPPAQAQPAEPPDQTMSTRPAEPIEQAQSDKQQETDGKPKGVWFGVSDHPSVLSMAPVPTVFDPMETLAFFPSTIPSPPQSHLPTSAGSSSNKRTQDERPSTTTAAFGKKLNRHDTIDERSQLHNITTNRAAVAVMAKMRGKTLDRDDYLTILDGMLVDPEMRVRLPPALVAQYDRATERPGEVLLNGTLVENFLEATKLATDIAAEMLTAKDNRPEKKPRWSRNRDLETLAESTRLDWESPIPDHNITNPFDHHPTDYHAPLTEYNLNQSGLANRVQTSKGKEKEQSIRLGWDEERSGVVRNSKLASSRRKSPYPRRPSSQDFRPLSQNRTMSTPNLGGHVPSDDAGFSVRSASTGLGVIRQEKEDLIKKYLREEPDLKKLKDSNSEEYQKMKRAESKLKEISETEGEKVSNELLDGIKSLVYYDLAKKINSGLISKVFLEFVSDHGFQNLICDLNNNNNNDFNNFNHRNLIHPIHGPGRMILQPVWVPNPSNDSVP